MVYFTAVATTFLSVSGFILGRYAAKTSSRRMYLISCACLSVVLLRALLRYFPEWEFALFPQEIYCFARFWWCFPFAFVLLGVGVIKMSTRRARIGVGVLTGLVSLWLARGLLETMTDHTKILNSVPDEEGICLQSSGYSCGPAVASTILAKHGIVVSEAAAAKACGGSPSLGTDEFSLRKGLMRFLPQKYNVAIVGADWDGLRRVPKPAAATIKFSFLIDHWVAVLDVEQDEVILADPLSGKRRLSREKFTEVWRKVLVVVDEQGGEN